MQSVWTRGEKGGYSASGDGDGGKPPNQGKGEHNDRGHYDEGFLPSALFDTSEERGSSTSGDGDGGKSPNQGKGEHNDHGHHAEDLLPPDALIDAVAELLRVKSLNFTVLDAIKRFAPQLSRQSGDIIIQLAHAIVAARDCSSDTTRKNETAVTGDADEVKEVGEHGRHKSNADGAKVKREHYFFNYFGYSDDEYA